MSNDFEKVASFEDQTSAEILAGMLRSEGVPAHVEIISPLPGLVAAAHVYVPQPLLEEAQQLIDSDKVTDAELNYAATGESSEIQDVATDRASDEK